MNRDILIKNINELLEKFVGGEIFFDQLDNFIRTNRDILSFIDHDVKIYFPHGEYNMLSLVLLVWHI